jgi:YHS domain-containing protein
MMGEAAKDPVCGRDIDPLRARAVGIFDGAMYYFCSADCKARFSDPRKLQPIKVAARAEPASAPNSEILLRATESSSAFSPVPGAEEITWTAEALPPLAKRSLKWVRWLAVLICAAFLAALIAHLTRL